MPTLKQLEEEREYFMYALSVSQDPKRDQFLEECLRNNAKRIEELREAERVYMFSDIPETQDVWDDRWDYLMMAHDLDTDKKCEAHLARMILDITGCIAKMTSQESEEYEIWRAYVNFVYEEWRIYDLKLRTN